MAEKVFNWQLFWKQTFRISSLGLKGVFVGEEKEITLLNIFSMELVFYASWDLIV